MAFAGWARALALLSALIAVGQWVCGARDQGNVRKINRPSASDLHPPMKPFELAERRLQWWNQSRVFIVSASMAAVKRWRLLPAGLVGALLLILAACGGGSVGPQGTQTPSPTSTPRGLLPKYTPTVTPTFLPGSSEGPVGRCPPLPETACAKPGDIANLYAGGQLDRVSALSVSRYGQPIAWVLDRERLQSLLRMFDREAYLFKYDILPLSDANHLRIELQWPPGEGIPWPGGTLDSVEFMIDSGPGLMGQSSIGIQWELPAGFLDALYGSLSDVTPTPPPRTPYYTPTITPTVLPPNAVRFGQPAGRLDWDGPDDRVWSSDFSHCSNYELVDDFGLPGVISVEPDLGFWARRALPVSERWYYTGYHHVDWQLWQGDDPGLLYVVHTTAPRVAFEYYASICF